VSAIATPYLDAHAHVQAPQFDADRAAMLDRARAAGIGGIICAGDDVASSAAALALAESAPDIWATAGVHPHEAAAAGPAALDDLRALLAAPRCVAIGEIGLDYFYDRSPRPVQREWFARQCALAAENGKPIVVHTRDAAEDTLAILTDWIAGGGLPDPPGLIHCFAYDQATAERFLALGFLLSIPGTVTYPRAETVRAVAAWMPEDRLTVETDCPYLAPQRWRGQRNEPAYLVETVRQIAALRGVDALRLAQTAATNARRLFKLAAAPEDAAARGCR
jgi:TatD DNase family protein